MHLFYSNDQTHCLAIPRQTFIWRSLSLLQRESSLTTQQWQSCFSIKQKASSSRSMQLVTRAALFDQQSVRLHTFLSMWKKLRSSLLLFFSRGLPLSHFGPRVKQQSSEQVVNVTLTHSCPLSHEMKGQQLFLSLSPVLICKWTKKKKVEEKWTYKCTSEKNNWYNLYSHSS